MDFCDVNPIQEMLTNNGICIRDLNNMQPNSYDSNTNQSNIIWISRGVNALQNNVMTIPTGVGFPYEKLNPFGEQRFICTHCENDEKLDLLEHWGIKITYYFYRT